MREERKGHLFIIGGAEDKEGSATILNHACRMLNAESPLIVLTTATENTEEAGRKYRKAFEKMGVGRLQVLDINTREKANLDEVREQILDASGIFMTGGDQLRITSILGGTKTAEAIRTLYRTGGVIMGTSAGASVMSKTMIVNGEDNEPAKKCTLKMAPGLGLLECVIIDQHFDQRGRFGRLLCGVAENPDTLGIGIDEDTAIHLYPEDIFVVIGNNAVTILDGSTIRSSNVSELKQNEILAITGVQVHVLPQGYGFNLKERKVMRLIHEDESN